jgi:NAD+ synthase (glutamine-hydrolysing)
MTVGYTTLNGDLSGFLAPIADLWKGQVYKLARFINTISGKEIIPQASIDVVPSAELSDKQDVNKGLGDPLVYPYHDKLFASWVERWDRATPEDNLRWYLDNTLAEKIGYEGDMKKLFPTVKDFIKDLEKWWNFYCGLAVAKRIQAPPVLAISRRAFGYDHRETQVQPYYTKGYKALKFQAIGE